jgi:PAS domain S-box-containing protein
LQRFRRNDTTLRGIALPGVFIGVGIAAMHYTGMAAMRMSPAIDYDPLLFATSVLIAIAASMAALWIAFSLPHGRRGESWYKIAAAAVMGAAIVGMHYTGMAAANFAPNAVCIASGPRLDATWLAITISAFTFVILGSTLLLAIIDARLQSTIARSAEALRIANEELERRVVDRTAQLQSVNHTLQAEIATRQRQELVLTQFAAIVESSDDAIAGSSLDGIITSWNRGAEKLFGYCAAQIIGQPLLKLIPPERAAEEAEILARIARGEDTDHLETIWVAQGGNRLDVSVTISPIHDGQDRIVGASTIARDITDRRHTLQKLRTQLERQDRCQPATRAG